MNEFNTLLRELGWSRAELGRRLALNKNTISHWIEPKGYAMAYLALALRVKRLSTDAAEILEC